MDIQKTNSTALNLLTRGKLFEAQELLRKNSRSGDYRAFNNLGLFYIENGVCLKNGKVISGKNYGIRYIQKACHISQSPVCLLNLAFVLSQHEECYDKAFFYYQKAYELKANADVFYNMIACLFEQHNYQQVIDILNAHRIDDRETILLMAFSLLRQDANQYKLFLKKNDICNIGIEDDIVLLLRYFNDPEDISLNDIKAHLECWYPNEYMWAIIVDVLVNLKVDKKIIEKMIQETIDGYANANKMKKVAWRWLLSEYDRESYILSNMYYRANFKKSCGYYGCVEHHINWDN